MQRDLKLYTKLFLSTFYLSAFTFGGGFVIIPLMKKKFADELHWIEEDEMLDLAALAQSAPGAVAVNASILIGYRVGGIIGAAVSIVGTVLPPLITLSIVAQFYSLFSTNVVVAAVLRGMRIAIAAVIAEVVITLASNIIRSRSVLSIIMMVICFVATHIIGVNVIYIILACAVVGYLASLKESGVIG